MESETLTIDKKAFADIMDLVEDMQLKLESLELMSNPEFMESYKKAKKEIEEGDLVDFDEL